MKDIFDFTHDHIEMMLYMILRDAVGRDADLSFTAGYYFIGRSLCIDINNEDIDTLTFNHTEESVGLFSQRWRKLMSIRSVQMMEELMDIADIHYKPKWT